MKKAEKNIWAKSPPDREELVRILQTDNAPDHQALLEHARAISLQYCGNTISLRGLIELSNQCSKNCYYCGIRSGNTKAERYFLSDEVVLSAADHAWKKGFGSLVIQSGERQDREFTDHISKLLKRIHEHTNEELGITLSCGEQSEEVYARWKEAGAHRYLLRIESSTEELYYSIHPRDQAHDFEQRLRALENLQKLDYQTGTGVMIGLPGQHAGHLADDLIFMKDFGIDMVGMGPYIPHPDTPMYALSGSIPGEERRLELSLRMIALLRIMMKDINIAASTAMQTLDDEGRVKAILAGANVFMPNLTPAEQACNYKIYSGKPVFSDMAESALLHFEDQIEERGYVVNYHQWGDSKHYYRRIADKKQEYHEKRT